MASKSPMGAADSRRARGRQAFTRRAWLRAYEELSAADEARPLGPEDLERLAVAAYLVGKDAESLASWTRAHREHLQGGDLAGALRCAFWLAFQLLLQGESAASSGWLARGRTLLADATQELVESGYLLIPSALASLKGRDAAAAYRAFEEIGRIADHFRDPNLATLGRLGRGQALIRLGRADEGVALLDEAMIAVTAGETSPLVTGTVYCAVIDECRQLFDLRRAHEWTAALGRWCASQPDLVPYRGQCLVHRAEIIQLHGDWAAAMQEAQRACEPLPGAGGRPWIGAAHYRQAELHRLRGDFASAEEAYRQAGVWGRQTQPGLALLRLACGRVEQAAVAMRRALDEATDARARGALLPAYVEIALAAEDLAAARSASEELARIAEMLGARLLAATSRQATGALLLAEGDAPAGLAPLREAWAIFEELDAPYEGARVRLLLAQACRSLGDDDAAAMELAAARRVFQRLGAAPDLARAAALARSPEPAAAGGLTRRELQVLRLVAEGRTNRAIATALFISEKTVARHVSNIFLKLRLSTRAAATAYAYQHELVRRPA